MTSVAVANKGKRLAYTVQSAFETINVTSPKDIRADGEITVGPYSNPGTIPDTVFVDAHDSELPVLYGQGSEEAIKFTTWLRQSSTPGSEGTLVHLFRAGGYTVATPEADTTLASYTSTVSYTMTDATTTAGGKFRAITCTNGAIVPVLINTDASGAAITPHYALPSASSTSAVVKKMFTITPGQPAPVPSDKFLSFFYSDRSGIVGTDTATVQMTGCYLKSIDDIVIEPGQPIKFGVTIGAADIEYDSTGILSMTTANDFADSIVSTVVDEALFYFAAAADAGSIAASYQKASKVTIKLGQTAVPTPGLGATSCVNGVQGAHVVPAYAEITIEALWDKDKLTDWEAGQSQTERMIAVVVPSYSATEPAFSFCAPRAIMFDRYDVNINDDLIKMTLKYRCTPGNLGSTTTVNDQRNQPFYLGWTA